MENTIYIGLSRQMALRTNLQIVANNVANMNTPGYRAQNMLFTEYLEDPRGQDDPLSFVVDHGQFQVSKPGSLKTTDNPLDVALEGPGFFTVETPDGQAYTRAGNFSINPDGELVTASGLPVSNGGGPIVIPPDSTEIRIDERGNISNQNGQIDQLAIVEFENTQLLNPTGQGLYVTEEVGQPSPTTRAQQGLLEGSNVNPIMEMTNLIEISRDNQSLSRMMDGENERLRRAIRTLTESN